MVRSDKSGPRNVARMPEYRSWHAMRWRCEKPATPGYERYGGRGIAVCERWRTFANFLADMGPRPEGTTIDRVDNERGYECGKPECSDCGPAGRTLNCRWATQLQQQRNRSDTKRIVVDGARVAAVDLYSERGVSAELFHQRTANMGWDSIRAATTPPREGRYDAVVEFEGAPVVVRDLLARFGVSLGAYKQRVRRGVDPVTAATTPMQRTTTEAA